MALLGLVDRIRHDHAVKYAERNICSSQRAQIQPRTVQAFQRSTVRVQSGRPPFILNNSNVMAMQRASSHIQVCKEGMAQFFMAAGSSDPVGKLTVVVLGAGRNGLSGSARCRDTCSAKQNICVPKDCM
jgi:hypothetical protein